MAEQLTQDKFYYILYQNVDGIQYVSTKVTAQGWTASTDPGDKWLFTAEEAEEAEKAMMQSTLYQYSPDEGFFKIRIREASYEDFLRWKGPSQLLTDYLTEGNSPEDLVKLLWSMITHNQRLELENEANEYLKAMFDALADNDYLE